MVNFYFLSWNHFLLLSSLSITLAINEDASNETSIPPEAEMVGFWYLTDLNDQNTTDHPPLLSDHYWDPTAVTSDQPLQDSVTMDSMEDGVNVTSEEMMMMMTMNATTSPSSEMTSQEATMMTSKENPETTTLFSFAPHSREPVVRGIDERLRWPNSRRRPARPHVVYPIPSFAGSAMSGMEPFIRRKNLTKVEYIKANCFDDYMHVDVRFNNTFKGLVYSAGYVHDPNCIYINGTGRSRFEFYIRLNQCGTLGRRETFDPLVPGEARRRDHFLWNTLTIQYNPMIEEDGDEHFRVTCEFGHDFWKTVTFPVVNVQVSTGSPVVFTLTPPQASMEIRRGYGTGGTRITGPVTVGDPLTLMIHMKSESAGYDILVSNCFAHNGAQQRLQLIDSNGCVMNEKLMSPFRGSYARDVGRQHVTLYAYLKAFRFTASPALYLECDIHMCHGSCPHQRCYWRNLAKRSVDDDDFNVTTTESSAVSESVSLYQALEVRSEPDEPTPQGRFVGIDGLDGENFICLRKAGFYSLTLTVVLLLLTTTFSTVIFCIRMRRMKSISSLSVESMESHQSHHHSKPYEVMDSRSFLRP